MIEVRPEVLSILESYGSVPITFSSNASKGARSLAMLKKNSKKRPRPPSDMFAAVHISQATEST